MKCCLHKLVLSCTWWLGNIGQETK